MRRQIWRAVYSLRRWHKISSRGLVDARHKLLRIAVDHREPRRLHLHHDAVALQKDVIVVAQRDAPLSRLVRRKRRRLLVAREIATAAYFHRDRQFVAIQRLGILAGLRSIVRTPRVFLSVLRKYIDEFHHEIAVASRS